MPSSCWNGSSRSWKCALPYNVEKSGNGLFENMPPYRVNKTNRCTEFQFYWYYHSICFGQPFCPSSGVLSRTSALVHFTQLWSFATRSRRELLLVAVTVAHYTAHSTHITAWNTCCHNAAYHITMYFYWSIPQHCSFSKAQHKLPEDGPIGPKHVGANIMIF